MLRIYVLIVFSSLLCFSCKTNPKESIEIIDLTEGLRKNSTINLSQIATDIEYISLETKKESLIGSIEQVKFYSNYILILDAKQNVIQIFDRKGNYLRRIDYRGKGPGEYISLKDFEICQKDTSIIIFDNEGDKLIKYNFKGEFINEWKIPEQYASAFSLVENDSFVFLTSYPVNAFNEGYSLSIYDKDIKIINKFLNTDIVSKEVAFTMDSYGMMAFQEFCDTLTYWEFRKDIVYKITDNKTVIPRYKILYPSPVPLNTSLDEVKQGNSLHGYIETCNYIFLWGDYNKNFFRLVYSKKSKKVSHISLKDRDRLNYGFKNDIDGGFTFYPKDVTSDGKLFCVFSMFRLKQFLSDKTNIRKEVLSEQKRAELMNLLKDSKPEDNGCIMLVTLK